MSWTAEEQREVKRALLGSWPGTITAWGKDAFAAFIGELEARGLAAERVLQAIRTWPAGSDFPPSAPNLAAAARKDPSQPTFEEAYRLIYGSRGVLKANPERGMMYVSEAALRGARNDAALERARGMHPLLGSFVERYGVDRLRMLEVDHPVYGEANRKQLRQAWERHCEAMEGRETLALTSGRRDGLGQLDPLAALGLKAPAQIGAGS